MHILACNWQQAFLNDSAEGRRMTAENISWSISTKVWDRAGFELATAGSAVRLVSVVRHVTDCAMRPGNITWCYFTPKYNVIWQKYCLTCLKSIIWILYFIIELSLKSKDMHTLIYWSLVSSQKTWTPPVVCMYTMIQIYGPHREKACLRGFPNRETQTILLSYRD